VPSFNFAVQVYCEGYGRIASFGSLSSVTPGS